MLGFRMKPGEPAILEWIREQGLDPDEISRNVILDDDGTMILERYVHSENGLAMVHPDSDRGAWKVPVRVTPTRPFPGIEAKQAVELRGENGPEVKIDTTDIDAGFKGRAAPGQPS